MWKIKEWFLHYKEAIRISLLALFRWTLLAVCTGVLCGGIGTLFHLAVEWVTEQRAEHVWLLWFLPAAGIAITALYKATGCVGKGTNDVLRAVQDGSSVTPWLVPAIFLGTVLTHLCGGSAGREGADLSAAISPNPIDRSNAITSARFISSIIGGLVTPIISLFIDLSNKGVIGINMRQLFLVMGIVAGTVGMGLFSLSGIFCRERVVQNSDEPKVLDCFRFLFKNKPLLLIVCSNILATVGGVTDTFAQYFYIFSLGAASWGTIIGIPGVVSGFLTYLLLPALERRWTSKQIVVRTTILKALVGTTTFLIGMKFYRNPAVIVPLLMIQGFIFSSLTSINMVVPTKMIGDTVDYMEWKTGERNEGMAFSLLTFISKLTGSLCTAIATAIIPVIGLVTVQLADNSLQLVENPQINTRFWLWALVTILPPVASLISLIPFKFYDLEGKKLKDIQEEMIARRELNSKTISKSEGEI